MLNPIELKSIQIPESLVMAELEVVLGSSGFSASQRLKRFLRYVVEHTLAGHAGELKEYRIAVDVFGRKEDFDPRADAIVRVEARQLRFKLADYYAGAGANDDVVIGLPKGGYAAEFHRRTFAAQPVEQITDNLAAPEIVSTHRTRWAAIAVMSVLSVSLAGTWFYVNRRAQLERSRSIVVLPLTNVNSNPANQYFVNGLTDEITDALSRVKTLRVVARSSASAFKGKNPDIGDVGRQLNVGNVLEGSVDRSGDRVKIIVHLERVADRSRVWSNTYVRSAQDLFAVQSELASEIAVSLKAGVSPPQTHVPNSEAHDAYMKGRYAADQLTTESLAKAAEFYKRAIELDPDYAAAYAGLGTVTANLTSTGLSLRTPAERETARQYWRKATALDPDLPMPHSSLAFYAMIYDWDWAGAERELQAALARQPHAGAEATYGLLCLYRKRISEADDHFRRSEDLDPLGTTVLLNVAWARLLEGRFAESRDEYQKVLARYPETLMPRLLIESLQILSGHPDLALRGLKKLEKQSPLVPLLQAQAKASEGKREEALRLIRPFEESANDPKAQPRFSIVSLAAVYAWLDDEANTLKWLRRAADERDNGVVNIAVNPLYARMRDTPGFRALKKRIGLE
ncbi:MAG: hypothetical protein M3Z36_09740 [Acidobacteriota bacterium]|nr:hypothetical protein [Acidobacteriota bacterium]